MHVHFVGIGGTGLSAIAKIMLESGYIVSGSDRVLSPLATKLHELGAVIYSGHNTDNIQGADLVIRSSAVNDDNPEVQEALKRGIPVLKRSQFMERLLVDKVCLAIAGTHGKTTTTAMIAWVLMNLEQDPSFIIGGIPLNIGTNAHSGKGPFFVIEADEYDYMFLGLRPQIAIITNVEHDHPDMFPTWENYLQVFREFIHCISPGGLLIACADDPGAKMLLSEAQALDIRNRSYSASDSHFSVELQVPGIHNVRNAIACLTLAEELGLPLDKVREALYSFKGTGRRFEIRGVEAGITLIDDYGHHPTEIRATLKAARERFPGHRLWAIWQPHTYSRTRQLINEFINSFFDADVVVITEIFAAREETPVNGFSSRKIAEAIEFQNPGQAYFLAGLQQAQEFIQDRLIPGDVIIVFSAGDADMINSGLLQTLKQSVQVKGES
jgi:UDP-N-acetylmuramate--alanine ligase